MQKDALISEDGAYRYWLTRRWADGALQPWVMLNPSTADADVDDPTIRRCMHFAKREGFAGLRVVNLYAFRAAKPRIMLSAMDPVGPLNDHWTDTQLAEAALDGVPVVCGWGSHFEARPRAMRLIIRANFFGAKLVCLGKSRDGQPSHPLYLRNDAPLEGWA